MDRFDKLEAFYEAWTDALIDAKSIEALAVNTYELETAYWQNMSETITEEYANRDAYSNN